MKSEFCKVRGEPRLGAGDAKIRRYREPQTAADGGAMNGGDDRLLVSEDAYRLDIEMVDRKVRGRIGFRALLGLLPRRIAEIGAGAERLALGGEYRGADLDIPVEILQSAR